MGLGRLATLGQFLPQSGIGLGRLATLGQFFPQSGIGLGRLATLGQFFPQSGIGLGRLAVAILVTTASCEVNNNVQTILRNICILLFSFELWRGAAAGQRTPRKSTQRFV
jgi:hypothetical protein